MDIVIRICVCLMLLGIGDTKEWKPETYAKGENATVRIDELKSNGTKVLEIIFSGYTSKLHVTNVMLYDPTKNQSDSESINRNYTGRINKTKMNNGSLSFLLLNVSFLDSGNYTVFEDSLEKGKTSIIVPRQILPGRNSGSMILPFMCNKTNISSIKIEMILPEPFLVVIYDVTRANCTEFGNLYMDRIESCLLSESSFSFTIQKVSWLDKAMYVAWDDKRFLLDSVFLDIQEDTTKSSLETTQGYVTLPSTENGSPDSSKFEKKNYCKWTTHVQGDNVNMSIDELHTNGNWSLEINFSGYSCKLHVTNMMLSDPKKYQNDSGSVNKQYTGQIQMTVINNSSQSILLLNVTFVHNGDLKVFKNSCEKRNASILVLCRRLVQQDGDSGTLPFMCNKTNIYSIKTDMMQTNVASPVLTINVTQGNCTYVAQRYSAQIQICVFSRNNDLFTVREVSLLEKATSAACDAKEFLLDSILIDVQGSSLETTNEQHTAGTQSTHDSLSSYIASKNAKWLLVSAVVIVVVAACLVMIAFRKLRHKGAFAVPNTATNNITYRSRRKTTANRSSNGYQNVKEAVSPEETRMVSAKNNNSNNLTDFTNNKGQAKVRLNKKSIYSRRLDSAKSSTRTSSNFQTHSLAHEYEYIHENDELKTHCLSYESNLRSKLSSTNSIESFAEPSFEYDYVVQHSYMTLRPPAPDPVVTRKTKKQLTIDDSLSCYERVKKTSSSRVIPSTLYAKVNKKTTRESNCTVSSAELGSSDFINKLALPKYFELEGILATDAMNSPSCLIYGRSPNRGNAENMNSTIYVPRPEFSELRADSKSRSVAQFLNYDYPRSYFEHPSAMDRGHRRSQSSGDMMVIDSVRWSRRRSPRTYIMKDCYNSL